MSYANKLLSKLTLRSLFIFCMASSLFIVSIDEMNEVMKDWYL